MLLILESNIRTWRKMREYICFVEQFLSNRIKNNFYDKQSCIQNHIVLKDLLDCGRNFPQQKKKIAFYQNFKKVSLHRNISLHKR